MVGFVIVIKTKKNEYKNQLLIIYFILALFWDLSIISPYSDKTHIFTIILGAFALNVPFFYFGYEWIKSIKIRNIWEYIKKNLGIIFVLLFYFILSLETIDDFPKADSRAFYDYIKGAKFWDFTFDTFRSLQYGAHKSFGYSIFSLIGEYLTPNCVIGVHLVQIIMMLVSIYAFYDILKKLFPNAKQEECTLITALYATTPVILGTIFEINLDIGLSCFVVWFFCSYLNKKRILQLFCALLLVFCKEPGIIILFGFGVGWLLSCLRYNKVNLLLRNKDFYYQAFLLFFPAICFLATFFIGDMWYQNENPMGKINDVGEAALYKWGFFFPIIKSKLKQLYIMNFSWILFFLIIIGFLYKVIKGKKSKNSYALLGEKGAFYPVIGIYIFFILFNFYYITFCCARYIMPQYFAFYILFMYALMEFKFVYKKMIYCSLIILFVLQTFWTVDPFTLYAFENINIGKGNIITTRTLFLTKEGILSSDVNDWINNEMINAVSYNRQYSYLNETIEIALKELDYSDDTLIVIDPIYKEYQTNLSILGKWNVSDPYYYDPKKNKMVEDDMYKPINFVMLNSDFINNIEEYKHQYKEIFVLTFPYNRTYSNKPFFDQLNLINMKQIEYRGWMLEAYEIAI